MIFFIIFSLLSSNFSFALKAKNSALTFDKALPEDISNENFPEQIDSFDFPDANLLDLVKAIGKLTGINFIVDPALSSKRVSIIAPSAITVAEAYKAFLSALSANGYTVVKSGAFWKIQSTEKALKDNIEVYSGDYFPNTDQLITRIIKLNHISAKDFESSIKWLLSQNNQISTHASSNSIILSDYGSVIERIMKIVYEMDVPGSQESLEIIHIEYASAEELSGILREILSLGRSSSKSKSLISSRRKSVLSPRVKKSGSPGKLQISNIIPDMRTNSLIVSANSKGHQRVKSLVNKLDTRIDPSRTGGVYVYSVLYGTAEEVYNTLIGIKPAPKDNPRSRRNIYIPGGGRQRSSQNSSKSPLFENVNIMADTNTNSLIISAKSKYEYHRVLEVLKKIDVPRDQVFIQAIILEMQVGKGSNTEFNLVGSLGNLLTASFKENLDEYPFFKSIGESALAGFLSNSIGLASLQQSKLGPGLILGMPFLKLLENVVDIDGTNSKSIRESYPEYESLADEDKKDVLKSAVASDRNSSIRQSLSTSFFPLIRLLRKSDNVNILSTPQITTLDNVPAFIEVGENAPVGLSNSSSIGGGVLQNSIERQDITLKLEILPRINPESGTIQMDIKQKFDDFSARTSTATELDTKAVSIIKRNIETKMVLHDGETAVLGGLLSDKRVTNHSKVPLLGDIPIIGWLFKSSDIQTEKRNLLVFIKPIIIRGQEQKAKNKKILSQKLEERVRYIEKYMKGQDPHEFLLNELIPEAKDIKYQYIETEEVPSFNETEDQNEAFSTEYTEYNQEENSSKESANKNRSSKETEDEDDIETEEETEDFSSEDSEDNTFLESSQKESSSDLESSQKESSSESETVYPEDYQEALPEQENSFSQDVFNPVENDSGL